MDSVRRAYDAISLKGSEWGDKARSFLGLFLHYFHKSQVVLDAGCGIGLNALEIAPLVKAVYAGDISKGHVRRARENLGLVSNISFVQADLQSLPFKDGFFDVACCFAVLHHLNETEQENAFAELFRVLKPGGLLLVSVWNKRQPRFSGLKRKWASVPWGKEAKRYYYFYSTSELVKKLRGFELFESFFEKNGVKVTEKGARNICLVLRKRL